MFATQNKSDDNRIFNGIAVLLISRRLCQLWFACCCICFASQATAQGPENTLVVVNANSQDSLAVANLYVNLRGIPACNVVYVDGISKPNEPVAESSNSGRFKRDIATPILKAIEDRGIGNQIDCVAYSAGFPTRINFQREMVTYLKNTGKKKQLTLHAPWASITSLTYFYHNLFSDRPDFLELDANHYANPRRMRLLDNPFSGDDALKFNTATRDAEARNYDQAIEKLTELASIHPNQIAIVYALSRVHALNGSIDKALAALDRTKQLGFASKSLLNSDPAFAKLRSKPDFQKIVNDMEDLPERDAPSRSFFSKQYWGKNGWPNGSPEQGERYLMSSVLAVTGKNQSTLEASLKRLKASVQADGSKPEGSVYFADHRDPRSRTRKGQFSAAVAELKSLGHKASIGSDIYPLKDPRVIGATLGSANPKWLDSGSKFLPGAICDNFTSFGAAWDKPVQTQLNEWLDSGAAGACGTVYEPYTIAAKIPSARWHAHYARGCTLAESFYQSVSGPFQLLLVGDPLCCPYGDFPNFEITGLSSGDTVMGDFELQIEEHPESPKIGHYEIFYNGVFLAEVKDVTKIPVSTDAMNGGYHELRIVGVTDSPVANKRSKKVGFFFNQKGQTATLDIAKSRVRFGDQIVGLAISPIPKIIKIQQNKRTLATVRSGEQFRIPSAKLGAGKSVLTAVVELGDGTVVQSAPIPLEVVTGPDSKSLVPDQKQSLRKKQSPPKKQSLRQIPSKEKLRQMVISTREVLNKSNRASTPEGRARLLKMLLESANESDDDSVRHYALLSECTRASSMFGSVEEGWSACEQIRTEYDIQELPHIQFIRKIKPKLNPNSARMLYSKGVVLIENLISSDHFDQAFDVAKVLGAALSKQLVIAKSEIESLSDHAKFLNREFKQIQRDRAVLARDPPNEQANANVGKFYCLQKRNFEQGLPYLAKGPPGPLRDLAGESLSLKDQTLDQRLKIADRWWELAEDKTLNGFRVLASEQYFGIVTKLSGDEQSRVEKRIVEEALQNVVSREAALVLATSSWRVAWKVGTPWDDVRLNPKHVVASTSKRSTNFTYRTVAKTVEFWNRPKSVFWKVFSGRNGPMFQRFDGNGKLVDSVLGVRND